MAEIVFGWNGEKDGCSPLLVLVLSCNGVRREGSEVPVLIYICVVTELVNSRCSRKTEALVESILKNTSMGMVIQPV
jgi:hypothetical protein